MPRAPRTTRPAPIGTIVPGCRYQTIDDSHDPPRWKTLADGQIDAPNPARAFMRRHGLRSMWIHNAVTGRRLVGLDGPFH